MKSRSQITSLHFEPLEDRTLMSTCHVTRLSDTGTGNRRGAVGDLRYCIAKVNAWPGADVIDVHVTGTINLTGVLPDLRSDIDIQGPGADLLTVRRNSGGDYRIFTISSGATVRISNLGVLNGRAADGGGIYNAGTLTLITVHVSENTVSIAGTGFARGGGIYNAGTLTLRKSNVSENTAVSTYIGAANALGGGIYNTGSLVVEQTSVVSNTATAPADSASYLAAGGGIFSDSNDPVLISQSSIMGNRAEAKYAGFEEHAAAQGGGISSRGGSLIIQYSTIADNEATSITAFGEGSGYAQGGGIFAEAITIAYSTISGNTVYGEFQVGTVGGGGIFHYGPLNISHSTISGNSVDAFPESQKTYGAGISNAGFSPDLTMTNCTIADNMQYGDGLGGGVFTKNVTITHSTIVGNLGLGIYANVSLTLRNSIVQNLNKITSSGYNLIINSAGGSGYVPSDMLNVDPKLGPLADNGGPTQTMALLPGSPAIDAGTNHMASEFDQRGPGFPRIVNGTVDIGAFEVQSTGAPTKPHFLAFLITADFGENE